MKYKNPWWRKDRQRSYGPEFYVASDGPIHTYREVSIYTRFSSYDYVIDGVCITQRAGISKYKEVIDDILDTQLHPINKRAYETWQKHKEKAT